MAEYTCPKCNRVFASTDDWRARNAFDEHIKYCYLPRIHKILQVVLLPFAFIGMTVFFFGGIGYLILSPVAYPFIYAMNLMLDNEVYPWSKFQDDVWGADRLKSFRKKNNRCD